MMNELKGINIYNTTIWVFIILMLISRCRLVVSPFVNIILLSLILAMALYPLYNFLYHKIGGRKKLKVQYGNGMLTIPLPSTKV